MENPIICSPFEEPERHWQYDKEGMASKIGGRRPAGYWYKTKAVGKKQMELFMEEHRDDLPLVNLLRKDVRQWRKNSYRNGTTVTKELLRYWAREDRFRRFFFCQREAVETLIYLMEIRIPGKYSKSDAKNFKLSPENLQNLIRGIRPKFKEQSASADYYHKLTDTPADDSLLPLLRMGCKMATGSGKTVVMAMLISWAFCNRGQYPDNTLFPNAVLICCPNLTVKERLQVLRIDAQENYYKTFDMVPNKYRPLLQKGKVLIENWHSLAPESEHKEGGQTYKVVRKGIEPAEEFARRVLKDLCDRMPVMVFNDEGHHCYRPAPLKEKLSREEKSDLKTEQEKATVWIEGLDKINNAMPDGSPGIRLCADFSATPFYIKGSGHPEGIPFPWVVSDFGLVDAIESGIVKIPRMPVEDTTGRPDPVYFKLWKTITQERLKPGEFLPGSSRKPKPEAVYRETEPALLKIAGEWKKTFEKYEDAGSDKEKVPPVLIIVCDNTDIAQIFYQKISGEQEVEEITPEDVKEATGKGNKKRKKKKSKKRVLFGDGAIFPEYLSNTESEKRTLRIDTKLLAKAEFHAPGKSKKQVSEELRKIVDTVGKPGQPGEKIRCVVSVSMLTEGWDANNVTHILGVRAFDSQLLCEQVLGRGLRRRDYDTLDPETGFFTEEYVDVYGIPFSVIPYKGKPKDLPPEKPKYHVRALTGRSHLELKFPNIEGYTFSLRKNLIKCDMEAVESLELEPNKEPVATFLTPTVGHREGHPSTDKAQFGYSEQTREQYYKNQHPQAIQFRIAKMVMDQLISSSDKKNKVLRLQSRHQLFPQVFRIVEQYVRDKIEYQGCHPCEIGLEKYVQLIVERLCEAIQPDDTKGEPLILPILNKYKRYGSTKDVDFLTTKECFPISKSHINQVVTDNKRWERVAAVKLDSSELVACYAKNDRLGLVIPYEFQGVSFGYEPDYLVRLTNKMTLVLEIKGYEENQDKAKHQAAKKWVNAVNNWREMGKWAFYVCRNPQELDQELRNIRLLGK